MAGKNLTRKQVIKAITLREAGFTLTSIAGLMSISVSTLQRAFKKHSVKKGQISAELIEEARKDLMSYVTSSEAVKREIAKLVFDDLAHSRILREKAAVTIEAMSATDTSEAALMMRALVAYSTLIKNTSETIRRSLSSGDDIDRADDDLPELIISEMTADDIKAIEKGHDDLM